jgi:predicted transcriptional regulator
MTDLIELEIRRKIYNLISKNPGLHALKIAEILRISSQLADYHLFYLERNDIVAVVKEEGYRRYHVQGKIGVEDRRQLALLRQKVPLRIVLFILKNPDSKHKDILKSIDIAPSTLTYHLKKLIKKDIIEFQFFGEQKIYRIKNKKNIIKILIKYKPYSWIDNFEDVWFDFSWK